MVYFTADFIQFFKELAANNHKEWFDANRKRYEKEVKTPFAKLVGEESGQLHGVSLVDRASHATVSEALGRALNGGYAVHPPEKGPVLKNVAPGHS